MVLTVLTLLIGISTSTAEFDDSDCTKPMSQRRKTHARTVANCRDYPSKTRSNEQILSFVRRLGLRLLFCFLLGQSIGFVPHLRMML